ncbi:MAG: hypothetical protein AB1394_15685, partial [Bacteroidota bacterium]
MKINQVLSFITSISVLLTASVSAITKTLVNGETSENILDLTVKDIKGKEVKLSDYKGKVL